MSNCDPYSDSPEPLVGSHHQSLLGRGSRHCHGINYTHCPGFLANRRRKLVLTPGYINYPSELYYIGFGGLLTEW
jgi:hypothetical protein